MRKLIAVVIALLSFVAPAFATVAVDDINGYVGEATNIYVEGQETSFDGSKVTVLANGHKEGVTTNVSGESNLTSAALAYGLILLADTGALDGSSNRYIALANGVAGQMVTIQQVADTGGTLYITDDKVESAVFPMTKTGWDDIAFADVGDTVTLVYLDDTSGWVIVGYFGVVVTFT